MTRRPTYMAPVPRSLYFLLGLILLIEIALAYALVLVITAHPGGIR